MNRLLIMTGVVCSGVWLLVTAITFGIPAGWCQAFDTVTFHLVSGPVFQLANGFHYDVLNDNMPTAVFLGLYAVAFLLVFLLILRMEKLSPERNSLAIILFFSVLFRLILWPGVMIHENDIYRYLWDGKTLIHGINPYKFAPADLFMFEKGMTEDHYDQSHDVFLKARDLSFNDRKELKTLIELRDENPVFFERIGHQQVPTIYPPAAQAVFALASLLKKDSISVMKLIFIIFDIGVIFLVVALLKHFHKNPCRVLVYGWSPLVLKEIANSGHYDSVAIFFMLAGVYLFVKNRKFSSVCSIAFSALTKLFSVVLLPVLARSFKLSYLLIFILVVVLGYLPFVLMGGAGMKGVFTGLAVYNQLWTYNAGIFAAVSALFQQYIPLLAQSLLPAKMIVGIVYLMILLRLMNNTSKDHLTLLHKCFVAIATLFIVNPVGDPWYFCWVMPFLCFFPYRCWIFLSGMLVLSYLNFKSDIGVLGDPFFHVQTLNWVIYLPFFVYLGIEKLVFKRRFV